MTRGLPDGASGYATVQIFWKDGWINRVTSVMNVSDPSISAPTQGSDVVVVGDLAQQLHGWDSGGSLSVVANQRPMAGATLMGWPVPGWMAPAGLGLWVMTLWLLYVGPPPRRATHWAWFWTLFSPFVVVAAPLFLAVGGPLHRAPRTQERERERRLTGGWSFLLVLLVAAATGLLH